MANITLATELGVANGAPVTPIPVGAGMPCSAFQLICWDDDAFESHMEISPDDGDTWVPYAPDTELLASGMIDAVFIGEGIQVRLANAAGTVSAILVPLP